MRKMLNRLFMLIFLLVIVFSGWKLYGIYSSYAKDTKAYEELADQYTFKMETAEKNTDSKVDRESQSPEMEEEPMISVDFQALKEACGDAAAWIYCPGTKINYPVVLGEDNEYYLHRLMNGEYSLGGTLFMDFRNSADFSDWNTIIYGHNMKNGSMFGIVPDYMEQEFYEEHPVWYLFTEDCDYRIELAGGYVTPADSDSYSFPQTAEEKAALAKKAVRSSSFRSNVEVREEDRLITLSTCVYDYENARYVLVGVLREMDRKESGPEGGAE